MRNRRKRLQIMAFIAVMAVFGIAAWQLVRYQLDLGDTYEEYSSLRSDPRGARVLLASLVEIPEITAQRNYKPLTQMELPDDTTFLLLGIAPSHAYAADDAAFAALDEFIKDGGRLVVTLKPLRHKPYFGALDGVGPVGGGPGQPGLKLQQLFMEGLFKRWQLELEHDALAVDDVRDKYIPGVAASVDEGLKTEPAPWHSSRYFSSVPAGWRTILSRTGKPVLIERQFGKGTVVVATDSYFLSNEGLRRHANPELISWVIGPNHNVIFDELHLGVAENPGVATLLGRYRLYGLLFGIALVAALFIWRSVCPLVPPSANWADGTRERAASGKTAAEGFVHLLRKHVPAAKLLSECYAEWQKTAGRHRKLPDHVSSGVARLVDDDEVKRSPVMIVEAYNRICAYLDTRKH